MLFSRRNMIILVLGAVVMLLQYQLWFKPGGIHDMMRMRASLEKQEEANQILKRHNQAILQQVQRLQKSDDAVESRARNELGMVKKGETFYQVVKEKE
jgi:cell division protein FtsB